MKNFFQNLFFHDEFTLLGWLLLFLSALTFWMSFSSSATASDSIKLTFGRTQNNKATMRRWSLVGMILSLAMLVFGFRDQFPDSKKAEVFKKCTDLSEGFRCCRTFDRKCIWVIRNESGAVLHEIEFPKEWGVIGIGVFKNGIAKVAGVRKGKKETTVALLSTEGEVFEELESD